MQRTSQTLEQTRSDFQNVYGYPEEEYPHITSSERRTLEKALIGKEMVKSLGKGFELGAHFVPICGDGNCFFTAVSTYLSSTKDEPYGTVDNHAKLRTKTCEYIKANPTKEPFNRIKNMNAYIQKKAVGNGSVNCWSDWYTMCGLSFAHKRPIVQVTYPRMVNYELRPDLPPSVKTMCGWNFSGEPIYIHYNGHNHYNAIVPIRSVEEFLAPVKGNEAKKVITQKVAPMQKSPSTMQLEAIEDFHAQLRALTQAAKKANDA